MSKGQIRALAFVLFVGAALISWYWEFEVNASGVGS